MGDLVTRWTSGESGRSSGFCAPVHGRDLALSFCVLRGQSWCKAEKEAESSGGVMDGQGHLQTSTVGCTFTEMCTSRGQRLRSRGSQAHRHGSVHRHRWTHTDTIQKEKHE